MKYQAVLFDNDGTLVDTQDLLLASFRHASKEVLGQTLPDDVLMAGVGTPLDEQMKAFTPDAALQEKLLQVYRTHNHAVHDQAIALFPGVAEGLANLHAAGLKLGVVTAKRHALAWHGLEVLGVAPYFSCLVGPDDCPLSKPHPEPVIQAAQSLDVKPAACLYVGDSPYDMQAGNAAGCSTVAVLWGMFAEDILRAEQPDFVISQFDELLTLAGIKKMQ